MIFWSQSTNQNRIWQNVRVYLSMRIPKRLATREVCITSFWPSILVACPMLSKVIRLMSRRLASRCTTRLCSKNFKKDKFSWPLETGIFALATIWRKSSNALFAKMSSPNPLRNAHSAPNYIVEPVCNHLWNASLARYQAKHSRQLIELVKN